MSRLASLLCLSLTLLGACAAPQPIAQAVSASSRPAVDAAALGVGDVFDVRVYQESDLSGSYRVGSDGAIEFPLLGRLDVLGKNTADVGELITRRLKDGYIRNPQVTVSVKEYNSKKVFVLGQVQRPGAYAFEEDMSVVNAIATAGGFTRSALPNETNITRVVDGKEVRQTVRVSDIGEGRDKNVQLAPGDIVFVPESIF